MRALTWRIKLKASTWHVGTNATSVLGASITYVIWHVCLSLWLYLSFSLLLFQLLNINIQQSQGTIIIIDVQTNLKLDTLPFILNKTFCILYVLFPQGGSNDTKLYDAAKLLHREDILKRYSTQTWPVGCRCKVSTKKFLVKTWLHSPLLNTVLAGFHCIFFIIRYDDHSLRLWLLQT